MSLDPNHLIKNTLCAAQRYICAGKYSHLEILEISLINESGQTEKENAKHTF